MAHADLSEVTGMVFIDVRAVVVLYYELSRELIITTFPIIDSSRD